MTAPPSPDSTAASPHNFSRRTRLDQTAGGGSRDVKMGSDSVASDDFVVVQLICHAAYAQATLMRRE